MKPPAWIIDGDGFDLDKIPVCTYCEEDSEAIGNAAKTLTRSMHRRQKFIRLDREINLTRNDLSTNFKSSTGISETEEHDYLSPPTSVKHSIRRGRRGEDLIADGGTRTRQRIIPHGESVTAACRTKVADNNIKNTDPTTGLTHVSLNQPLDGAQAFTLSNARPLPRWMIYLPTNRSSDLVIDRRPSRPIRLPSQMWDLDSKLFLEKLNPPEKRHSISPGYRVTLPTLR